MATITEEITQVIQSFKDLSGVGICFYDLVNFFSYSLEGKKANLGHYCSLCSCVRLLEGGRTLCERSDRRDAVLLAQQYKTPFFTRCHIGLCELVVPLYAKTKLKGVIFLGQCRIENEDASQLIAKNATSLGGSEQKFVAMYQELPIISRENLLSMGKILQLYFKNISAFKDFSQEGTIDTLPKKSSPEAIANWIDICYRNKISSKYLSERFYLNQSYMEREFKKVYSCTITEYICKIRIENAKLLLEKSDVPIHSIALNVGFSDANYFSRVFSRLVGVPPGQYRQNLADQKSKVLSES